LKASWHIIPILLPHQFKPWQHSLTSVPIHITSHIGLWQHSISNDLIHIVLQIGREIFLSHNLQSTYHFKLGHESIYHIRSNPQSTSNSVMTSSYIICSNPHSTSNWSWELPVTSFPIHSALQIRPWQHYFTFAPIHRTPQVKSWHHPLSSVLIHIVLQICCRIFRSHPFQTT
jgi:hypothetical protein